MSFPFTVIIPARFASSRLPGKPLADILGKPMIQHVYQQVEKSDAERIVIATDHADIEQAAKAFGAEVCMTSVDHESGTDRLQEVARRLNFKEDDIVVNVQGDEPLIPPAVINQVAALIATVDCPMATLYETSDSKEQLFDPNVVKVVTTLNRKALYFSRAPQPFDREGFTGDDKNCPMSNFKRHIGIYAYRVSLLNLFVQWPAGQLETIEKLEQLRVLENGLQIALDEACEDIPAGVDTGEDLARVRNLLSRGA